MAIFRSAMLLCALAVGVAVCINAVLAAGHVALHRRQGKQAGGVYHWLLLMFLL
jgi:hypothetical protein